MSFLRWLAIISAKFYQTCLSMKISTFQALAVFFRGKMFIFWYNFGEISTEIIICHETWNRTLCKAQQVYPTIFQQIIQHHEYCVVKFPGTVCTSYILVYHKISSLLWNCLYNTSVWQKILFFYFWGGEQNVFWRAFMQTNLARTWSLDQINFSFLVLWRVFGFLVLFYGEKNCLYVLCNIKDYKILVIVGFGWK